MNLATERLIASRACRIVDLRTRLARENDPWRLADLEIEIDRERRELVLLLHDQKPEKQGAESFTVRRSEDGTLSIHLRRVCLPVNSAYLEHLVGESKIVVPPKGFVAVSPAFAQDAIEEAVAQVNHDIAVSTDLRRRLAFFHRLAESFMTKSDGGKACA